MSKLSTAYYTIRSVKPFTTQETLRVISFSYGHSIFTYGIIIWGISSYCDNIFKIQKRIIRVITNSRNGDSCHTLFKKLNILPLKSKYIFPPSLCAVNKRELYKLNPDINSINTRHSTDLHPPISKLTTFQMEPIILDLRFLIILHLALGFYLMR